MSSNRTKVSESVHIGHTATLKVIPVNPGLVYATVLSCDVTFNDIHVRVFGANEDKCTTSVLGAAWLTDFASSKETISGRKEFKQ